MLTRLLCLTIAMLLMLPCQVLAQAGHDWPEVITAPIEWTNRHYQIKAHSATTPGW